MRLVHLSLDKLELHDELFRSDFREPSQQMISAARNGIWLEPLSAIELDNKIPILVSGFRRFQAAMQAGVKLVPVILFQINDFGTGQKNSDLRKKEEFPWILLLNCLNPSDHTPLEIACVLGKVSRYLNQSARKLLDMSPLLKNMDSKNAIIGVSQLPEAVIRRMQKEKIDIRKAAILADLKPVERPIATLLTCRLTRMSLSRMRRFFDLIRDLSVRKNIPIHRVMQNIRRKVLSLAAFPVTAENVLSIIEAERSPVKHDLETQFNKLVEDLSLSKSIHIGYPPDFEGDKYTIKLSAGSIGELRSALSSVDMNNSTWQRLFNLIRDEKNDVV